MVYTGTGSQSGKEAEERVLPLVRKAACETGRKNQQKDRFFCCQNCALPLIFFAGAGNRPRRAAFDHSFLFAVIPDNCRDLGAGFFSEAPVGKKTAGVAAADT